MSEIGYNTGVDLIKSDGLFQQRRHPFSTDVRGIDTMSDHTTRQSPEVKVKLCECGCGQPAPLATKTDKRRGHIKGQPLSFVRNHSLANPFILLSETVTEPGLRAIPLTQGKVAIVDAADYEWLMRWKWHARKKQNTFYASRDGGYMDDKHLIIQMHRLIVGAELGQVVDHIDGNGLNNTRHNLRICTHQENLRNRSATSRNKTGFKGVSLEPDTGKWRAKIKAGGKTIHLGVFATAEEAARAYDAASTNLFGEFGRNNFR